MKKIKLQARGRILIRAANWVGDAIMTTPVVRALRKNFPQAHITVLAKPWVIPVYAHNPYIDEVMVYENQDRHKMGLGTLRLALDLRQKNFHLAILMQNAFEAALLAFLAGIDQRVGYNTDARTLLLNRCVRLNPALKKKHLIEYYNGILKGAGLETDGLKMDLFLHDADRSYAENLLDQTGLSSGARGSAGPIIGINPGATGGTAKRWFPERYGALAEKLARQYKTRILIFGGPADHALGEKISAMAEGMCINLAGQTSLGQAFALISCLDLFVTNDSGLMHAAAALNIPQAAVIGSTDVVATAPASDHAVMVREKVSCSPCCKEECPKEHQCMDRIGVERVMGICQTLLDQPFKPKEVTP